MKKTQKIITSLAALGALCVGGVAVAQPWHHGAGPAQGPGWNCPVQQQNVGTSPQEVRAARWEALAKMLTLKPEQKAAWDGYVAARDAFRTPVAQPKGYAADEQTRLEQRAERAKIRSDQLGQLVAARSELLKVLSPEQKFVLEAMEAHHGDRMKNADRRGPCAEGNGFGPRGPFHHPGEFGPGCPGRN